MYAAHSCTLLPLRPRGKHTHKQGTLLHTLMYMFTRVSAWAHSHVVSCTPSIPAGRLNFYTYVQTHPQRLPQTSVNTPSHMHTAAHNTCIHATVYNECTVVAVHTQTHTRLCCTHIMHKYSHKLTYVHIWKDTVTLVHTSPYTQHVKHSYTSVCECTHTPVHAP